MTEGMGLPDGEITVRLTGFRPASGRPGVKIDVDLSEAALRQLVDAGGTGAVDGTNLRVELQGTGLAAADGPLDVVELLITTTRWYG